MSKYVFINTDNYIKEIDQTNSETITVKEAQLRNIKPHELIPWSELNQDDEVIVYENEDDFDNLQIYKANEIIEEIKVYIDKKYVYTINGALDIKRGEKFVEYIKENITTEIDLISIW